MSYIQNTLARGRLQHRCTACGTTADWSDSWEWYGSFKDLDEGRPIVKTCSDPCRMVIRCQGGAQKVQARLKRAAA